MTESGRNDRDGSKEQDAVLDYAQEGLLFPSTLIALYLQVIKEYLFNKKRIKVKYNKW